MTRWEFSAPALHDVSQTISRLHKRVGPAAADRFESLLFAALAEMSRLDGPGHRRPDLTTKDILFYKAGSYSIIFQMRPRGIWILRVVHSARDIAKLL